MVKLRDFLLHLRLHYNVLILSAPFLLGALYLPKITNLSQFFVLFLLLYVGLYGGANVYNSYFDKDEGPIGGLHHPPKVTRWMYVASWIMQFAGLLLSVPIAHRTYTLFYALSMMLFWMYSSPLWRLKGRPVLSCIAIGISSAFNTTLMGYNAGGGLVLNSSVLIGVLTSACMIVAMHPVSQIYQIEEDAQRGDRTFAVAYGIAAVKNLYRILFLLGVVLLAWSFLHRPALAVSMFGIGIIAYAALWQGIKQLSGRKAEFCRVMNMKYNGGMAFTFAILGLLIFL